MSDRETILLLAGLLTVIVCLFGVRAKEPGGRSLILIGFTTIGVCLLAGLLVWILR